MTSGPASEVNDWRLRLSSVEIVFICSLTFYSQLAQKSFSLQLMKRESVVVSAAQLQTRLTATELGELGADSRQDFSVLSYRGRGTSVRTQERSC